MEADTNMTAEKNTTSRTRAAAEKAGARVPEDHKDAVKPVSEDTPLPTIEVDGVTYTAKKHPADALQTFGVMRQIRKAEDWESLFIIAEAIFNDDALDALGPKSFEEIDSILAPVFDGLSAGN